MPDEPITGPIMDTSGANAAPVIPPPAAPPPPPPDISTGVQPSPNEVGPQIPPPRPPGTSGLAQPQTRSQIFRGILGDFLYSAGKGLAAAGHGPEANYRGAGAAISALPERAIMQRQIGYSAAAGSRNKGLP